MGFLVPLGIFLEAGSPIILATSHLTQTKLALPLSFFALPIALVVGVNRLLKIREASKYRALFFGFPFIIYTSIFALFSAAFVNPMALVNGVQWLLPFFWAPYFLSLRSRNFGSFAEGFVLGSFGGAAYYFAAGILEIMLYGALQDFGRITQNLIFPGQYQIAVYVPTVLAYSVLLSTVFIKNGVVNRSRWFLLTLNLLGLFAIFFTASREGILVFVIGHILITSIERRSKLVTNLFVVSVFAIFVVLNFDLLLLKVAESDFRMLNKFAALQVLENRLGGRENMINEALNIYWKNPLFGTNLLSPQTFAATFVSVPSAHNIYVDAFVWTGLFGGIFFLLFSVAFLVQAFSLVLNQFSTQLIKTSAGVAVVSVTFILLSNNINVPWRQPLTAPIGALLLALCFNYRSVFRR